MSQFNSSVFDDQQGNANSSTRQGPGRYCRVYAYGNFDGATVKLQMKPVGASTTDWVDTAAMTFTASGFHDIFIGQNEHIRGVVTGAGVQTEVSLDVLPLHKQVQF